MKTVSNLIGVITIVFMLSSFIVLDPVKIVGTYGVSASDPSQIKLVLEEDQTFFYQDLSRSNQKLVIQGTWAMKGNKVELTEKGSESKFHNVWSFDQKGMVAKSRKGLSYYRLCRLDD